MEPLFPGREPGDVPTFRMHIDPYRHLLASWQNVLLPIVCLHDSLLGVRVGGSLHEQSEVDLAGC